MGTTIERRMPRLPLFLGAVFRLIALSAAVPEAWRQECAAYGYQFVNGRDRLMPSAGSVRHRRRAINGKMQQLSEHFLFVRKPLALFGGVGHLGRRRRVLT
jgi:hypothetical protein